MLKTATARTSRGAARTGLLPLLPSLVVAAGAGLLLYLAFPRHDLWYLAPVGVGSLVVVVTGRRARTGALLGFVAGLAQCLPQLAWAGVYVGVIAWIPLSAACAAFTALAGALIAWGSRCPGGPFVRALVAAGVWVGCEGFIARFPFGGFGWVRLAFSQADAPTLGYAALGGAPLVSFAVALVGALLGAGVVAAVSGRAPRGRSGPPGSRQAGPGVDRPGGRRVVTTPAVVVVLLTAAAAVELGGALVPSPDAAQAGSIDVAGVQGDVPRAGLAFNAQRRAVLDDHARETARLVSEVAAGTRSHPQLVVWPENSSDIDVLRNPDAYDEVQAATDAVGVPLLMGTVLVRDDGRLRNTSMLWEPGRGPVASYDKRHPVPFGEYIPDRAFFRRITSKVDLVRADFVAGHRVGRIDAGTTRLGVMICFEVVQDDLVSDTVDHGADLLVVQTNNATFGYTDESVQQLAMSRLRAVEHGRAVVHVSTVGRSALVMPDGRLVQETRLFTPALVQAQLPLRTSLTVADRVRRAGVPTEGLLALLGAVGAGVGGVRSVREQRARRAQRAGRAVGPGGAQGAAVGPAGPKDPAGSTAGGRS